MAPHLANIATYIVTAWIVCWTSGPVCSRTPNVSVLHYLADPGLLLQAEALHFRELPKNSDKLTNFADSFFLKQLQHGDTDVRQQLEHLYETAERPIAFLNEPVVDALDKILLLEAENTNRTSTPDIPNVIVPNTLAFPVNDERPNKVRSSTFLGKMKQRNNSIVEKVDPNENNEGFRSISKSSVNNIKAHIIHMLRSAFVDSMGQSKKLLSLPTRLETVLVLLNKTKEKMEKQLRKLSLNDFLTIHGQAHSGAAKHGRNPRSHMDRHGNITRPDFKVQTNAEMNFLRIAQRPRLYIAPRKEVSYRHVDKHRLHFGERLRNNLPIEDHDVKQVVGEYVVQEVGDVLQPFAVIPIRELEIVEDFLLQHVGEIFKSDGMPETEFMHMLQIVGDIFDKNNMLQTNTVPWITFENQPGDSHSIQKKVQAEWNKNDTSPPTTVGDTSWLNETSDNSGPLDSSTSAHTDKTAETMHGNGFEIFLAPEGHLLANIGSSRLLQSLLNDRASTAT